MPVIKRNNNLFEIRDLRVGRDDNGHYLTMNSGHSVACVICVSAQNPVTMAQLSLSEQELVKLSNGGSLSFPEKGYTLQGVTRPQLAAAPQFRNFHITPPCHVQVWGMSRTNIDDVVLHMPENPLEQHVMVPVEYAVEWNNDTLVVWIQTDEGYSNGDLMYQVADHKPVPIPRSFLNTPFQLRPGAIPTVFPAPEAEAKYRIR